jgi:hypothetical protein
MPRPDKRSPMESEATNARPAARLLIALFWVWAALLLLFCVLKDTGRFDANEESYDVVAGRVFARENVWLGWLFITAVPAMGVGVYGYVCLAVAARLNRPATEAPVCLRCGYLLVGNTSGKCPECFEREPDENERRRHAKTSAIKTELLRLFLATLVLCMVVNLWPVFSASKALTPVSACSLIVWWSVHRVATRAT